MISEANVLNEERKNIKWKRPKTKKQQLHDIECDRCGIYYEHDHEFIVVSVSEDIREAVDLAETFTICQRCCNRIPELAERVFFTHVRQLLDFAQSVKETICSRCGKPDRSPECRTSEHVYFSHVK